MKLNPVFDDLNDSDVLLNHIEKIKEGAAMQTNSFPVEVFPLPIQQIIRETNEHLNFPIDFIGASILYAISVAIGNTHKVEVMKGYEQNAVLYLAIVGRAGTNKSHPLTFALNPIEERDKRTYRQYEAEQKEFEIIANLSKGEREKRSYDEATKPTWKKFIVSDFTPEALTTVHQSNKRGIGVYADELAGWFKNFNRYNSGSEMEFWLSVWSGKPINIDRKTGEPVFIPLPFISVAGTIQNGILSELAKDNRTQNGFIDRMLFVIPDDLQKTYWSETELSPTIIQSWEQIISRLLDMPLDYDDTNTPQPKTLRFSPNARKVLFEWQRDNTDQSNKPENEAICGIFSKLEMYAIRFALILEMMRFACGESAKDAISVEAVNGALKLVEYFKQSAIKVRSVISNINPLDKLPIDKQTLYKALPKQFTTETGLQVAKSLGVAERTFKRFLTKQNLFSQLKRGEYQKLI
jgi:hypothetical protein